MIGNHGEYQLVGERRKEGREDEKEHIMPEGGGERESITNLLGEEQEWRCSGNLLERDKCAPPEEIPFFWQVVLEW